MIITLFDLLLHIMLCNLLRKASSQSLIYRGIVNEGIALTFAPIAPERLKPVYATIKCGSIGPVFNKSFSHVALIYRGKQFGRRCCEAFFPMHGWYKREYLSHVLSHCGRQVFVQGMAHRLERDRF